MLGTIESLSAAAPDTNVGPSRRRVLGGLLGGGLFIVHSAHSEELLPEARISIIRDAEGRTLRRHAGKGINVFWNGKLCIHARYCVTGSPKVFIPTPTWDVDLDTVDSLAHVIRQCPSGALTYERFDGQPSEQPAAVNTIRLTENGPLTTHAEMNIEGYGSSFRAQLCRCGNSKNKPFCDNSHRNGRFVASGDVAPTNTSPLAARNGQLNVRPIADGPLEVSGNLEICNGAGTVISRSTATTLCRCGHSSSKPFCDGSHVLSGFKAEGVGRG
jgi:CDGSH-type Zn-finger protein/uncharacterized Fe-S cluster protein YjdI